MNRLHRLVATLVIIAGAHTSPAHSETGGNSILNLYDAFGPEIEGVKQDFGFSSLIRWNDKLILFDAGTNAETLKQNVRALGVDLTEIDFAIASHSHFDHINGFDYLLEVNPDIKIYFPNDPFFGAPLPFDATGRDSAAASALPSNLQYFDGDRTKFTFDQSGRFWKANIQFVAENHEIAPGINLIATRSPFMGYFSAYPHIGIESMRSDSEIKTLGLPELSLSLSSPEGEILIVGCSHSLVEKIVRETRTQLKNDIALVMGGYHLLPYGEQDILGMAQRMKDELGVKGVAPSHCTGHLGLKVFRQVFGDDFHHAGLGDRILIP